jgi:putative Mn2+ efflux pump MntP
MDALAVAISKGLSVRNLKIKHIIIIGLYFGGFQALMPFLGFILGTQFKDYIVSIDHWIAFVLLCSIGVNMIRESRNKNDEKLGESFGVKNMLVLSVATSIDALAVGVTFAFLRVNIVPAVIMIGSTTFIISAAGVKIGNIFGEKYKSKAEIVGGLILIGMGIKILLDHLKG